MATTVQLQKAFLMTETKLKIECMFNPAKFSFSMSNRWQAEPVPGSNTPAMRYAGGESGKFSLSLVFDTTATGKTVTTYTNKLLKLMEVDTSLSDYDAQRNSGRPPWVTFHWGTELHTFKSIISSLQVSFTYFSNEGLPLRASVDASFEQYQPDANWVRQNPTSGTPNPQRVHIVSPGETLDRISARYYGDATRWRAIAGANGIKDPLSLAAGTALSIPERSET